MKQTPQVVSQPLPAGEERSACTSVAPAGFHLRLPPPAHEHHTFITPDTKLFETIHMGSANVDLGRWRLQVDGLVERPFSLNLEQLVALPTTTVAAVHECWGSPLRERTTNLLRVGNVKWTGVRLSTLLSLARPLPEARFVWSEGLDSGEFGGKHMECYRKDLPLEKALADEVLIAYAINGEPLRKERGGPVRLVVPGWFGTNMTKWLCHLSIQSQRAPGPFTTVWYNEDVRINGEVVRRPVWHVEPNCMIVEPAADRVVRRGRFQVKGWAWAAGPVAFVEVSINNGQTWEQADLIPRQQHEWQAFTRHVTLDAACGAPVTVIARATDANGKSQPLGQARNACHSVTFFLQADDT